MTKRQLVAYADPSARAFDSLKPKFKEVFQLGERISTILTVNK
jgi:hypothetical protein